MLDGFTTTTDNLNGLLPTMMRDAGFTEVREVGHLNTLLVPCACTLQ